jgi:hypothetical protein
MHFRDCRKPLPFRVHLINVDKPCKDTANRAHIERVQREGGMCLNILCALKTTRLIHTVLSFGHRPVLLGHCGKYYLEKRKSPHTLWVYFTTAGCRQQQQHSACHGDWSWWSSRTDLEPPCTSASSRSSLQFRQPGFSSNRIDHHELTVFECYTDSSCNAFHRTSQFERQIWMGCR